MMEEITNKVLRQVVAKLEVLADEEVLNPGLFPTPQSFTFNSLRDVIDSLATMCDYYGEDDYENILPTDPTFVDSSADTDTTEGPLPLAAVGAAVIIGSNI